MPKVVILTYNKNLSRYRKIYKGRQWHSKKCNKSDREAYRLAVTQMEEWKAKIDEDLRLVEQQSKAQAIADDVKQRIQKQVGQLQALKTMFQGRNINRPDIDDNIHNLEHNPNLLPIYENKPAIPIEPCFVKTVIEQASDRTIEQSLMVSQCYEDYKAYQQAKVDEGKIKASSFDQIARNVRLFSEWLGNTTTEAINGDTLPNFRQHLVKTYNEARAASIFKHSKSFLKWLYERERLNNLPRNFNSPDLYFQAQHKEVTIWTAEQWQTAMSQANERLKLYLLLMLNCGMYQGDIADLKQNEIDWQAGTIKRKRTKTAKHDKVPTVVYPLWPETLRLLNKHRASEGDHVLLTSTGTKLVRQTVVNGKTQRVDIIHQTWFRFLRETKLDLPAIKCLRKSGASAIASKFGHGSATYYLAHAPQGVAERHYIRPSQDEFNTAVLWLAEQFPITSK